MILTTIFLQRTLIFMKDNSDQFTLYDLRIDVVEGNQPMVCNHRLGTAFFVEGEDLVFPGGSRFSLYALAALLPLLPAKQRYTHAADWMTTDDEIACPDPNCGARFRIVRTGKRTFTHNQCTVVPMEDKHE